MNLYQGETGQEYYDMRHKRRDTFVQIQHAKFYQPHIKDTDIVLDFGCGTGGILSNINCAKKIGIEVNEPSMIEAKEKNIEVFSDLSEVADNSVDVVMSNHAIEHVTNPEHIITELKRVLKKNGKAILVVPAESPYNKRFAQWKHDDPDHHVFSWTPLSFGNLINQCGLNIEKSVYRATGFSKLNRPIEKVNQSLYKLSRHVLAFLLRRYEVVCIAKKL